MTMLKSPNHTTNSTLHEAPVKYEAFVENAVSERTGRPLRVCMLAYAFYESDTRILQYATALAQRADSVDVIALRRDDSLPAFEVLNGVNVYRIQSRTVNEKGLFAYGSRIMRFLFRSMIFLHRKHRQHPYDV